jgi:hypothetical protein
MITAGLLTLSISGGLPILPIHRENSGKVCHENYGDYSSGYCPGITPGSLLSGFQKEKQEP